jgi:choline kinase
VRVIVPAAGRGARLRPYTDDLPKPLVPVAGVPMLERSLGLLADAGAAEVVVVTGYLGDRLREGLEALGRRPPLRFVHNPDHDRVNSIVSLHLTRACWAQPFCVIDADVLYTPELLATLLAHPGDALVLDGSRAPAEMDMRVECRHGAVWHLGKDLPAERAAGEFFGLSTWTPAGAAALDAAIEARLRAGDTDVWYELAIGDAAKRHRLEAMFTDSSQWVEVDGAGDLAAAETFVARASAGRSG